jgi:hypothetical protein
MTLTLNYQKRKNTGLFNSLENHSCIQLKNIQNYIPIYNKFFSLNTSNYNSVNLNHLWYMYDIKDSTKTTTDNENIFTCKLQNIKDQKITSKKVFFKMAPLLDPCKYLVGKYDYNNSSLFNLPLIEKNNNVHPKLLEVNNSSYIDGFFVFLTSLLLNNKKFIHGVDYYGSFLSIKKNYKINIIDDLEYLSNSDFFNKQKNILFHIPEYSRFISDEYDNKLIPIKIHNKSHDSRKSTTDLSIHSIDDNIFENIFETNNHVNLGDLNDENIELIDITELKYFQIKDNVSTTLKSTSTCSSRTSHTETEVLPVNDNNDNDNDNNDNNNDNLENESLTNSDGNSSDNISDDSIDDENESITSEEVLEAIIPEFPVQVICMENCHSTFDELIINNELSTDEWFSAFMQIIMILITYQKLFSFTHNDLHTNNIMYITTPMKYIYYCYQHKYYKVPTFGKIYKIIDFGRSIYKFNNQLFCSDSFKNDGDASTQYNTEPFFNDKKSRLEPNYSFDLCRLGCSIFDYIVDDFQNLKHLEKTNPVVKLVVEWCLDDNGLNVLYKNNGDERYPDFKLYKMIARFVHNHLPHSQLERPEFKKYITLKQNIPKGNQIINIDEL